MENLSLESRQIIFKNVYVDILLSPIKGPYKSIGDIISFLYGYKLVNEYDTCTIGNGVVNGHKGKIADFVYDEEKQIPIFQFTENYQHLNLYQNIYLEMLNSEFGINYIKEIEDKYKSYNIRKK